jgi:cytochrome d ubiquinol oxidase subunit I
MIAGDATAPIPGVKAFPKDDLPPLNATFQTFHVMVAIGTMLAAVVVCGVAFLPKGRLFRTRWLLWIFVGAVVGPQIANQLGWATAEIGRQPWIVYRVMRTIDGLSPVVHSSHVIFSLVLFTLVYALLFVLFLFLLNEKIQHGPLAEDHPGGEGHRA